MIVYDVGARFSRTVRPRDYESATSEISMKAQLEDGESTEEAAQALIFLCREQVLNSLGGKKGKAAQAKSEGEIEVTERETTEEKPASKGKKAPAKKAPAKKQERQISDSPEDRKEEPDPEEVAAEADAAEDAKSKKASTSKGKSKKAKDKAAEDTETAACENTTADLQKHLTARVQEQAKKGNKEEAVQLARKVIAEHGEGATHSSHVPEHLVDHVIEKVDEAFDQFSGSDDTDDL